MTKYSFIDLFAGCGGLSEGFLSTDNYEALAHIEWDLPMVNTLRHRLVQKWNHTEEDAQRRVIHFDVQKTDELFGGKWKEATKSAYEKTNADSIVEKGLDGLIDGQSVDLIIGGPPCQAYSIAGRAQSANGMKDDYRNYLFESFVKIVDHYKPKAFVFENVPGLLTACPGGKPVKERIYEAFKKIGYEMRTPAKLPASVYCAEDFNTPQKRNRIIIIGVKKGGNLKLEDLYASLTAHKNPNHKTVKDAIGDLPKFKPLSTPKKEGRVNVSHELIGKKQISLHIPRYHSPRDVQIFKEWISKGMNKYSQEEKKAFYTKITGKSSNHIKYRNLEWDKPSPTVVAHLNKDGLMFIHPDVKQLRSITIREAALLQSFPIDFEFIGSHAYCYKMIGNAVPVNFARGIAESIYEVLEKNGK